MIAIAVLLFVVALSLLVTRVATVILVATGLSPQVARFQARSALSGAGFTTSESEQVVNHPVRRRVIMNLMLLGSGGIVAGIGTLVLGFRRGDVGNQGFRILELVVGLLVLLRLSRSQRVDRRLTALVRRLLERYSDLPRTDLAGLLQLSGDFAVSELTLNDGDWAAGRRLGDLDLREEGMVVLGITHASGRYLGVPSAATTTRPGDVLVVYGRTGQLRELDDRPAGEAGERAHRAAAETHRLTEARG